MSKYKINTKCVQDGYQPKNGDPRVLPIYQSTTYYYETGNQVGKLFDLEDPGFMYTRLGNPTSSAVEEKIASLEGGSGALLTASGQAAIMIAVLNICNAGDHIVATNAVYGGTFNLFSVTLKKLGIETTFLPTDVSEEELRKSIKDNTRLVYSETLSNPLLEIPDLEMFAKVAHENNIPFYVDNTFATPINCRPFEFGADVIVHSTSKYMEGHAVALGGAIIDSGKFNWNNGKFPELSTPDESYHGVVYTERFKETAFITKARVQMLRDIGSTPSPTNSFLLNLGLETMALRVERHCSNAEKVAEFLESNDKVLWVNYPTLKSNKYYDVARKYLPNGTCGVVSFGVKGGKAAAMKLMDSLNLAAIVVHVADARTSILHPASTTHRQLSDEQLIESGVLPEAMRLSVGIEDVEDIIDDLKQGLEQI